MEASLPIGFCIAAAITFAAWRLRALDDSGSIAALLMGTVVFGLGGLMPSAALVLFFVSGSLLSALPGKSGVLTGDEAAGRSWKQVFANGFTATTLIALAAVIPQYRDKLLVAAVASIAAAAADSWSTEIGARYGGRPRDILTWRPVAPGISGGITPVGLTAAVLGGLLVALSTYLGDSGNWQKSTVVVTSAAFFGAIIDSIFGSGMQGKYVCGECGELTEGMSHCGKRASRVSGTSWLDNNGVNLATTLLAAIFCLAELDFGL